MKVFNFLTAVSLLFSFMTPVLAAAAPLPATVAAPAKADLLPAWMSHPSVRQLAASSTAAVLPAWMQQPASASVASANPAATFPAWFEATRTQAPSPALANAPLRIIASNANLRVYGPSEANVCDTVTYTVVITNDATLATNVVITSAMPSPYSPSPQTCSFATIEAGGVRNCTFAFAGGCLAVSGQNVVTLTQAGGPTIVRYTDLVVNPGAITVRKEPAVQEAYIEDVVSWTVYIENTGYGDVVNVVITDVLGSGLSYVSGLTSAYVPTMSVGQVITFPVSARIIGCANLDNVVTATWGCNGESCLLPQTATGAVDLQMRNPDLVFTLPRFDVPFCAGQQTFTVPITNTGDGTAYSTTLITDLSSTFSVTTDSEVTYAGDAFHLPLIAPGETYDLVFTLTLPSDVCTTPSGGTFNFDIDYYDICDNPYFELPQSASWQLVDVPGDIGLSKSMPVEVYRGETVTATIAVDVSGIIGPVVITDTVPDGWTIIDAGSGMVFTIGDTTYITWEVGVSTTFDIVLLTPSDTITGCEACGTQMTNVVAAWGTDCQDCVRTASASASTYIQCDDGITSDKQVSAPLVPCSEDTFTYTNTYIFGNSFIVTPTWGGLIFTETLPAESQQTYVTGTATIWVSSGSLSCTATFSESTAGGPLVITNISPTCAIDLPGATLQIIYQTQVGEPAACSDFSWYDWSYLNLGVTGNDACAYDGVLQEGVFVETRAPQMQLTMSGLPPVVSSCGAYTVTLTAERTTPDIAAYNAVIDLVTDTFAVVTVVGFDGALPLTQTTNITGYHWYYGDAFATALTATVQLHVQLRCTDTAPFEATLSYDNLCGSTCPAGGTLGNPLVAPCAPILTKFPEVIYATDDIVVWSLTVYNSGAGPAYNVTLTDTLGSGLRYVDSTITSTQGSVAGVTPITSAHHVTWTLPVIQPKERVTLRYYAEIISCDDLTNVFGGEQGCQGEACMQGCAAPSRVELPPTVLLNTNQFVSPIDTCYTRTVTVTVRNAGLLSVYSATVQQTLPPGLYYVPGTTEVSTDTVNWQPGPDPAITGSQLSWGPSGTPLDFWLARIRPSETVYIRYDTTASCPFAGGVIQVQTAYFDPCGDAYQTQASSYLMQSRTPELTFTKVGQHVTRTHPVDLVYAEPGETVVWTITVANAGGASPATNVVVTDTLPYNAAFVTATTTYPLDAPPATTLGATITWTVGIVNPGQMVTLTVTSVISDPDGCSPLDTRNYARLTWGCDDGCRLEENDDADLRTIPVFDAPGLGTDIAPNTLNQCGGVLTVTLVNNGPPAYNIVLTDTLPGGFVYSDTVYASTPPAGVIDLGGQVVYTWGELPTGVTTIAFRVRNAESAGDDCEIPFGDNVIEVLYDDHPLSCLETGPYVVSATQAINIVSPTLTIDKSPPSQTVDVGEPVTWTLTVQNTGSGMAYNVVVTDIVGTNYVSVVAGQGSDGSMPSTALIAAGTLITWYLDDIPAGGVWTTTVTAVLTDTGENINRAWVQGGCDTGCVTSSDDDNAHTTLLEEFSKLPEIQTGTIGSLMVFHLAVSLSDWDALYENVILTDTLPGALGYLALGYVASVLTYTYDVDESSGGPITNVLSTPSDVLPTGEIVWNLGALSGTVQINAVITTVVNDVPINYDGVQVTNRFRMTYTDDGVFYEYEDSADVNILEPVLHIGKTYVTPHSCAATLLEDNFNRAALGDSWTPVSGDWFIPGGTGYASQIPGTLSILVREGFTAGDFSYSAMVRAEASSSRGLVFRYTPENYYVVRLLTFADGGFSDVRLEEVGGAAPLALTNATIAPAISRWYHLEVRMEGDRIQVFVDGVQFFDVIDPTPRPAGSVGLYANECAYGLCRFDDVLVTRLENSSCYVGAGDLVTYTLTISNQAQLPAYDLVITDVIPAGTSFVTSTFASSDPMASVIYTPAVDATGVLTWGVDHLNPTIPFDALDHTSITLTVVLRVSDDITANIILANQAFLVYDGQEGDGPLGIERDYSGGSHSTAIRTVNGGIVKLEQFDPPPTATLGTLVTYTLIVPASPISATLYDVVVTDTIDSRLYIESIDTSPSGVGVSSDFDRIIGLVTATFTSIPHGEQAYITVTARISHEWPSADGDANAGETITNTAVMTHSTATEITTTNEVSTTVGEPNVAITKSVESSAVSLIDLDGTALLTYTLRLENSGSSPAYSLYITDYVPSGISVTAQYGGDARSGPILGPGTLTWTVGTLSNEAPDNVLLLTYTARITPALSNVMLENTVDLLYHSLTDTIPGVRPYTDTDSADVTTAPPTLHKTTDPITLRVGDLVTYTLVFTIPAGTVGMGGNSYLYDVLPPGVRYITGTSGLAWTPSTVAPIAFTDHFTGVDGAAETVTWVFGDPITSMQAEPTVITLTFQAQATGEDVSGNRTWWPDHAIVHPITNTVQLWQRDEFIDEDTVNNEVIQPDLSIDKDSTPPSGSYVGAGASITYTLTIVNQGHGPAYDIIVIDTLPVGIDYVRTISAPNPSTAVITPLIVGQQITYTISELAAGPGATMWITVVARVTDTIVANLTLTNTAAIPYYDSQPGDGPGPYDPGEREYTDGEDSVVHYTIDASIIKAIAPPTATIGSVITYTIRLPEPPITATLYDVVVTDHLSPWLELLTLVAPDSATATSTPNAFTVTYTTIPTLEQRLITVTAVLIDVGGDPVSGNLITNVVTLEHSTGVSTSNEVTVTVAEPDVSLRKTVQTPRDPSDPLGAGDLVTYTLTLSNTGNWPAYDLVVTDSLPVGLDFVSDLGATVTDPTTAITGGAYPVYTASQLNVGGYWIITFTARVRDDITAGVTLTNVAWGVYDGQPGENDDEREYGIPTDTVPVDVGYPVLDLVKFAEPSPVEAGGLLTYTLTVTNTGIVSATGVVVTDAVPLNTTYLDCGPLPCNEAAGVVSWTLGILDVNATRVLTMLVRVDSPLFNGTILTNTAWVTSTEGLTDTDTVTTPVVSQHTLAITKTADPSPVQAGDLLTYTLAWSVSGNEQALGVTISDTLPAYTSFVTATLPHTLTGDLVRWPLGTQNPGASGVVTLVVQVDTPLLTGTVLSNAALITDTQGITDTDTVDTPVESAHTLVLTKTADPAVVQAGGLLTYTLAWSVAGNEPALGLTISDTVPQSTTFWAAIPAATSAPGVGAGGLVTWDLGDQNPLVSGVVTLVVLVDTPLLTGTVLSNAALITDTQGLTDTDTVDTPVESGHTLALTKTAEPAVVQAGALLTYTLEWSVSGNEPALGVTISDTVPANTAFDSCSGGLTCGESGGLVTWDLGDQNPPASGVVTLVVRVDTPLFTGTVLSNAALITDTQGLTDTDTVDTPVESAHTLALTKTAEPAVVQAGALLTYTLAWSVSGNEPALGVTISDTIPANTTYWASAPAAMTAPPVGGTGLVTWDLDDQNPPASGVVTLVVRVDSDAPTGTLLYNAASITDTQGLTDTGEITTPVNTSVEIWVTKTGSSSPVTPGEPMTYSLTITNDGPSDAENVVVTDTLPAEVAFVSADPPEASGPNPLVWNLGTLTPGESRDILITVTVYASVTERFTNTVIITTTTPGDNPDNNEDDHPVDVAPLADVAIVKSGSHSPAVAGGPLVYTLVYTNYGPSDAQNVVVTDTLPDEVTFVAAAPDRDSGPNPLLWNLGTLAAGDSGQIVITVTVNADVTGTFTNTVVIATDTPESDDGNNDDDEPTDVVSADEVGILKTVTPFTATIGDIITYTLLFPEPPLGAPLDNVTVTDQLSPWLALDTLDTPGGTFEWDWDTWTFTATYSIIPAGEQRIITVTAEVISDAWDPPWQPVAGDLITNVATLAYGTVVTTSNEVTTTVVEPDLVIVKVSDPPQSSTVGAGQAVTYTVTVTNVGGSPAYSFAFWDELPVGMQATDPTLLSAIIDGRVVDPADYFLWTMPGYLFLSFDNGVLPVGSVLEIIYVGYVDWDVTPGIDLTNTASIDWGSGFSQAEIGRRYPPISDTNTVHVGYPALELVKSAAPDPVEPGGLLTYTLTVANTGVVSATDVVVTDTIPVHTTFVTATMPHSGPAPDGNPGSIITWALGTLDVDETRVLTMLVQVDLLLLDGTLITNTAWLTSTEGLTDTVTVTTPVMSSHSLAITKTASPDPVQAGDLLTYTLAWSVDGNEPALGVTISDTVPAHTTFITCTGAACSEFGGLVIWSLGDQNPPASGVVTLVVLVDTPLLTGTVLYNAALISDTQGITDTDTVTTPIESAHTLAITKTVDPAVVYAGDLLTYTLEWAVDGNEPALGVTISDTVPQSTTFWAALPPAASAPDVGSGGTVIWALGDQHPPASGVVTLVVRVDSNVPTGTLIHNAALISDTQGLTDTDTVDTPVETSVEIWVMKTGSASPVTPGEPMTYSLTVVNDGPSDAENVVVTDTLPAEVTFDSASPTPTSGPNPLVWNLGTLTPGERRDILITVTVNANVTEGFTNTVIITTTTPGDDPGNNEDDYPVDIVTRADLAITKSGSPDPVVPGETLIYTLVYTNYGPSDAENVVVADTLPAEVMFVSASPTPDSGPNPLVWNLGNLATGASGQIVITVTVNSDVTAPFTNTVVITSDTPDNNPDDNTDEEPTQPLVPGMELVKTVLPGAAVPNMPFTYVIVITNTGYVTLNPLILTDTLPSLDFHYVAGSATPSEPVVIAPPLLVWPDLGPLDPGASITVSFGVTVTPGITNGTYWNVALATGEHPGGILTDTDDVPIVVEDPAIALSKHLVDFDNDIWAPNFVTFTIAITNVGISEIDILPLYDIYDADYLHFADAFPVMPNLVDNVNGQVVWFDLTAPAPHGFGRNLLPGESFTLTTVFTVVREIDTPVTNTAVISGAIDIYDNPTPEEEDQVVIVDIPTAVDLLYFRAVALSEGIRLEWATAVEMDNFGFTLHRATEPNFTRASEIVFIPSACRGNLCGATYDYLDTAVEPGRTYWYWLVDVDLAGQETAHGPVSTSWRGATTRYEVFLPLVMRQP